MKLRNFEDNHCKPDKSDYFMACIPTILILTSLVDNKEVYSITASILAALVIFLIILVSGDNNHASYRTKYPKGLRETYHLVGFVSCSILFYKGMFVAPISYLIIIVMVEGYAMKGTYRRKKEYVQELKEELYK